MTQKILITGVASHIGLQVATRLCALAEYEVLGVDTAVPYTLPSSLHFVQVDMRNPLFHRLLQAEAVDVVCHLGFREDHLPEVLRSWNVAGGTNVMTSAMQAGVKRLLWLSATAVYGAIPAHPAFIPETAPLMGSQNKGFTRQYVELEAIAKKVTRDSQIDVTTLRLAPVLGMMSQTRLTQYLRQQPVPSLLGFDPTLQLIDEADVIEAVVFALTEELVGAYNVANPETLPVSRLLKLSKTWRLPLLHSLALLRQPTIMMDWSFLRYRCVADIAKLSQAGFAPQRALTDSIADFLAHKHLQRKQPNRLEQDQIRLRNQLEQQE